MEPIHKYKFVGVPNWKTFSLTKKEQYVVGKFRDTTKGVLQ